MPTDDRDLEALRREIDEIDDEIHDLIMRRTRIAEGIGLAKRRSNPTDPYFRPAREAIIMRRLMARHTGSFPMPVIARIWREIISATLGVEEGGLVVSVYAPDETGEADTPFVRLARGYFGAETQLVAARTESGVLRSVRDGKTAVGVLPVPSDEHPDASRGDPWWLTLAAGGNGRPMIVARLPWLHTKDEGMNRLNALAVAKINPEPSGDDVSLIALESSDAVSRDRIKAALAEVGLEVVRATVWQGKENNSMRWLLIEITTFVAEGDRRLAAFEERLGDAVRRIVPLGGYAAPPESGRP